MHTFNNDVSKRYSKHKPCHFAQYFQRTIKRKRYVPLNYLKTFYKLVRTFQTKRILRSCPIAPRSCAFLWVIRNFYWRKRIANCLMHSNLQLLLILATFKGQVGCTLTNLAACICLFCIHFTCELKCNGETK